MKETRKWWQNPATLFAGGIGGGAALIGISYFVIAMGNALGFLLGSLVAGTIHGTVGYVPLKSSTAGMVSVTILATAVAVFIVFKTSARVAKAPFVPLVVVLGVLQTFLLDLTIELWPAERIGRLIVKTSVVLLFVIASLLWRKNTIANRIVAVIIFTIIPILVVGVTVHPLLGQGIIQTLQHMPAVTWLALAIMGGSVAIAMMASRLE